MRVPKSISYIIAVHFIVHKTEYAHANPLEVLKLWDENTKLFIDVGGSPWTLKELVNYRMSEHDGRCRGARSGIFMELIELLDRMLRVNPAERASFLTSSETVSWLSKFERSE